MTELLSDPRAVLRALDKYECETSLLAFVRKFFALRTGNEFIVSRHHLAIIEALEAVVNGTLPDGARNLIINIPPRYGKTELAVVNFVAWCMARNPSAKFIHLSYADKLVLDNSSQIRDLMKQPEFLGLWPITWRQDTDAKGLWRTKEGGGFLASPAGGSITGFGAGRTELDAHGMDFAGAIIIDDPLKPDDALGVERENVNERLVNTIMSRRNSRETPIVLIMQRLHEEDMTGYVLDGNTGEKWHHVRLEALSEDGTALWPHKHTAAELRAMEAANAWTFSGQYQQRPSPKGGGIIKKEWWQPWLSKTLPKFDYVFASIDTAYTEKQINDPSAITVWGIWTAEDGQPGVFMVFAWEGRESFPSLVEVVADIARGDPDRKLTKGGLPISERLIIENKAAGISLAQELRRVLDRGGWAIEMFDPKNQDKVARVHSVSHIFAEGLVSVPYGTDPATGVTAPRHWAKKVIDQCAAFPTAKHDDLIDTVSQALRHVRDTGWLLRNVEHRDDVYERSLLRRPEEPIYPV